MGIRHLAWLGTAATLAIIASLVLAVGLVPPVHAQRDWPSVQAAR